MTTLINLIEKIEKRRFCNLLDQTTFKTPDTCAMRV